MWGYKGRSTSHCHANLYAKQILRRIPPTGAYPRHPPRAYIPFESDRNAFRARCRRCLADTARAHRARKTRNGTVDLL